MLSLQCLIFISWEGSRWFNILFILMIFRLICAFFSEAQYSLHINCGGTETTIRKSTYDEDDERGGAAKFVPRRAEWGFSSSGEFWYSQVPSNYIAKGNPLLGLKDSKLYMTARLSATSLTYYGSCLGKGNYSVTLHFHEIVFANNSYSSLGRRIFDIYIQVTVVNNWWSCNTCILNNHLSFTFLL